MRNALVAALLALALVFCSIMHAFASGLKLGLFPGGFTIRMNNNTVIDMIDTNNFTEYSAGLRALAGILDTSSINPLLPDFDLAVYLNGGIGYGSGVQNGLNDLAYDVLASGLLKWRKNEGLAFSLGYGIDRGVVFYYQQSQQAYLAGQTFTTYNPVFSAEISYSIFSFYWSVTLNNAYNTLVQSRLMLGLTWPVFTWAGPLESLKK